MSSFWCIMLTQASRGRNDNKALRNELCGLLQALSVGFHLLTHVKGLPYKYIVAIDSRSFSEAPAPIINALNHLTWAGKDAITDGSYRPFNELLCLGYMEKQAIGVSRPDPVNTKLLNKC